VVVLEGIAATDEVFHVVRSDRCAPTWAWARQDLDSLSVPAARAQLRELLGADDALRCLLVHLGVDCFVDLRGLRLLLAVGGSVRRRGADLAVVAPPPSVLRMARLLELGDELPVLATVLDAARWARRRLG